MKKYEHYIIVKNRQIAWLSAGDLNNLANEDGWIFVNSVCPDFYTQIYTFRREIKED